MTDSEFEANVQRALKEEFETSERWLYLSFASEGQFHGAVVLMGHGVVDASMKCHAMGINPGGQVACWDLDAPPAKRYRNRLLTRDDINAAFGSSKSIKEALDAGEDIPT